MKRLPTGRSAGEPGDDLIATGAGARSSRPAPGAEPGVGARGASLIAILVVLFCLVRWLIG